MTLSKIVKFIMYAIAAVYMAGAILIFSSIDGNIMSGITFLGASIFLISVTKLASENDPRYLIGMFIGSFMFYSSFFY